MKGPIRVLLADDHPLIRAGIETILSTTDDVRLVGLAVDGQEVLNLCRKFNPDVLVLDLKMPGPSPREIIAEIQEHCPEVKILILSAYDDEDHVRGVLGLGIVGYVLKGEDTKMLMNAIRTVVQGGAWFSQRILSKMTSQKPTMLPLGDLSIMTKRERQVLELIALGRDHARIASDLNLAEQTVRNYASQIYNKLKVTSRAEAIVWAREHGFSKDQ
ncbi:MAG: response regulator transcription factor [Anaerolineae bacterium]|nr:response regulator transcription factor [Anaerolineae bacterium]